ncbi:hypothetical protein RS022_00930 [Candidatus Phytoplasma rubi]|uniref:Sequence-variable mosaic (SVM) signal sequence domain-containing protein n=1 Tax=Candidatus Phytoplasma rubi TaxID=399025 RepID=A0ABY7BQR0_9MOLU|nr:hypothetical protein [Candidatus Phytoplasma rubi]WAN63098.1 hypothetical protein RS022_00930 [Candidatus Phytoplasma rubi]
MKKFKGIVFLFTLMGIMLITNIIYIFINHHFKEYINLQNDNLNENIDRVNKKVDKLDENIDNLEKIIINQNKSNQESE